MSQLLTKATSLIDLARRVREEETLANRRSDYENRRRSLQAWVDDYKKLAAQVELLVRENVATLDRLGEDRQVEALRHITGFLERFNEDPSTIIEGDAYALLDRDLATVEQLTLRSLRTAWERYYDAHVHELREEAIEIQLASPHVAEELKQLHARLRNLRGKLPTTGEDVQTFRTLVSRYDHARQEAWRSVLGDEKDVPPSVQEFVRSVQDPRACTLESLTPEILNWLKDRRLADRFRVQLA